MVKKPLIIYHANCIDGFCAAWVAHKLFGEEAEYHAASYGDPSPNVADRVVYILDFSYPPDQLRDLAEMAKAIVLLDHHKTAAEALRDFYHPDVQVTFDMERSGAGLAWDTFFPGAPRPWIVSYAEDRDLWRFRLPHSQERNAFIGAASFDWASWDALDATNLDDATAYGEWLLRQKRQYVTSVAKAARLVMFEGQEALMVNAPYVNISEVLNHLALQQVARGVPGLAIGWHQRADGRHAYSLRSVAGGGTAPTGEQLPEIDVSELARRYGGGGHKNASGFMRDDAPDYSFRPLFPISE